MITLDVFYEESAIAKNPSQGIIKYKILGILSILITVIGIISLVYGISQFPVETNSQQQYVGALIFSLFFIILAILLFVSCYFFHKMKLNCNLSFDYTFVSWDLRIVKISNNTHRRKVASFTTDDILQIGDVDNPDFERFSNDPNISTIYCSPNLEATEGKFFMYILTEYSGKKLFVLECRENLLMNILKFAKRGTLEHDYVMQDKKQQK